MVSSTDIGCVPTTELKSVTVPFEGCKAPANYDETMQNGNCELTILPIESVTPRNSVDDGNSGFEFPVKDGLRHVLKRQKKGGCHTIDPSHRPRCSKDALR